MSKCFIEMPFGLSNLLVGLISQCFLFKIHFVRRRYLNGVGVKDS